MKKNFFLILLFVFGISSSVFAKTYDLSQIAQAKPFEGQIDIEAADTIIFGSYPQSDVSGNTKDPIEWLVVKRSGNTFCLLSKYVLDVVDWEMIGIRDDDTSNDNIGHCEAFLNNNFKNIAFSNAEQEMIVGNIELPTMQDIAMYSNGFGKSVEWVSFNDRSLPAVYLNKRVIGNRVGTNYADQKQSTMIYDTTTGREYGFTTRHFVGTETIDGTGLMYVGNDHLYGTLPELVGSNGVLIEGGFGYQGGNGAEIRPQVWVDASNLAGNDAMIDTRNDNTQDALLDAESMGDGNSVEHWLVTIDPAQRLVSSIDLVEGHVDVSTLPSQDRDWVQKCGYFLQSESNPNVWGMKYDFGDYTSYLEYEALCDRIASANPSGYHESGRANVGSLFGLTTKNERTADVGDELAISMHIRIYEPIVQDVSKEIKVNLLSSTLGYQLFSGSEQHIRYLVECEFDNNFEIPELRGQVVDIDFEILDITSGSIDTSTASENLSTATNNNQISSTTSSDGGHIPGLPYRESELKNDNHFYLDNTMQRNVWVYYKTYYYHVDQSGNIQKNQWIELRYVGPDGRMYRGRRTPDGQWVGDNGLVINVNQDLNFSLTIVAAEPDSWYRTQGGLWYYFENDRTTTKKGWFTDARDNQTYYLDPGTGIMAVGWTTINGSDYYFNDSHDNVLNWYETGGGFYESYGKKVKAYGSMFKNETTPDGKKVDGKGRLIK